MSDFELALDEISRSQTMLVATDYDGTLAHIVPDPDRAAAIPGSIAALNALAALPRTYVAVISGRGRKDLAVHLNEAPDVCLVGGHGSEFENGLASPILPGHREVLDHTFGIAHRIAGATPGILLEKKLAGFAFHYRNSAPEDGNTALARLLQETQDIEGLHIRHGKMVVELSVVRTHKGQALETLRKQFSATAVLFLGDDVTDEDAFAALREGDIGIKVGPGQTKAQFRIADPRAVAQFLGDLAQRRGNWVMGREAVTIA